MVRGASRDECQQALDELCRLLGARPTNPPTDRVGPGWVARAQAAAPTVKGEGRAG